MQRRMPGAGKRKKAGIHYAPWEAGRKQLDLVAGRERLRGSEQAAEMPVSAGKTQGRKGLRGFLSRAGNLLAKWLLLRK